jgi:DNA-binding transcriptional MerR regulator
MKNRKFYSVTQTCKLIGIKPYVLKHWEKVFEITPTKNSAGRRIYSQTDIEKLACIRHLIYREHFTIQGAKRRLEKMKRFPKGKASRREYQDALYYLKKELITLKTQLQAK